MKRNTLFVVAIFLVFISFSSCGKKDSISAEGTPIVDSTDQRQEDRQPKDPEGAKEDSFLQIACESRGGGGGGIFLPNSLQPSGDRTTHMVDSPFGQEFEAPAVLSANGVMAYLVYRQGSSLIFGKYDFQSREFSEKQNLGSFSEKSPSFFKKFHRERSRVAVGSPRGSYFLLSKGKTLSLRSVSEPKKEIRSYKVPYDLVQGRWEAKAKGESEVFFDYSTGGKISQYRILLDEDFRIINTLDLRKDFKSSYDQVNLQSIDDGLAWLEVKNGTASALKILKSGKLHSQSISDEKFGPGMAIYKKDNQLNFVLQSIKGLSYYQLDAEQKISLAKIVAYPERTLEYIELNRWDWSPGELISVANHSQLYTVLPFTWGRLLYRVMDEEYFRQLGYEFCINPSFVFGQK
ncbi:MAG: hypothetical protein M9962_08175 [Oligoflexia bacterium]|nr:hypothetical protein [Oligoflexia bacterium]